MNKLRARFKIGAGLLLCGLLLLSSRCSEKTTTSTEITKQPPPAPPQITEIVTITPGNCAGYYAKCPITVHYPVFGNTIGPIPVPCGKSIQADIRLSGGQLPFTFTASLPAGMILSTNGALSLLPPCSAAGQTLTAALAVTDGLGRTSPTITASFLIQSQ